MSAALFATLLVAATPDPTLLDPVEMRYSDPELKWDESWERFRWWEYVLTGVAVPGGLALRFFTKPPGETIKGDLLFDEPVEDLLLADTLATRNTAADAANIIFGGAMLYRAVDDLLVVGLGHGNGDVALQMSMIDLEAFGIVAAVLWGTQLFVGRTRPHSDRCGEPGIQDGDLGCASDNDNNRYRSFIAGHPATVVAATGVTCMHHSRMPIYGGGWADNMACISMIGASAATGVLRIVSGSHHATDVVFGTALGLVAGWIVPSALHYGFGERAMDTRLGSTRDEDQPAVRMTFIPIGPGGGAGIQVAGVVW